MKRKQFEELKERITYPLRGHTLTPHQCKELDEEIKACLTPIFTMANYTK